MRWVAATLCHGSAPARWEAAGVATAPHHDALGSRDALPRLRAPFGQLSRRRVGQPHALLRLRITTRWAAATIAMDAGLELQPLAESCDAIVVYTGTCGINLYSWDNKNNVI